MVRSRGRLRTRSVRMQSAILSMLSSRLAGRALGGALVAALAAGRLAGEEGVDDVFLGDGSRTAPVSTQPRAEDHPSVTAAPAPKAVPDEWPPGTLESLSLQSERASEALFNLIEDVEVAAIKAGHGVVNARVGRRVFDNHDVLGSWTVVDHIRLDVNYPFYALYWPIVGPITGGWSIGGDVANGFIDIRQVLPRDFARLPSLEERAKQIQSMPNASQRAAQSDIEQEWTTPFAGLEQARWSRLWNMITFPARAPTSVSWVSHMENDEVLSFLAEGTIEIGPELLWQVPIPHFPTTLNAQASAASYIYGQFRISILKENDRFVRVRLTRQGEAGVTGSAGGFTSDVINGFSVVSWHPLKNKTEITPFTFNIRHGKGRAIDVVYRYDLSQEQGRQAYEAAVAGRFRLSEELSGSGQWRRQPAAAAVRHLGDRDTVYTKGYKGTSARYSLIYRHSHESTLTSSDITAEFPESTARVYRSDAENDSAWRFIWGSAASFNYRFRIDVDRDRSERHLRDAATMVLRGELTNSDTSGDDLYDYMDEAEGATGRHGFFPRPPRMRPSEDFPRYQADTGFDRRTHQRRSSDIDYGRSSFYYQLTFSQDQLTRFVDTPDDQRWGLLERAFGQPAGVWASGTRRVGFDITHLPERLLNIPLYALNIHYREGSMLQHARAMIDAWRKAATGTTLEERMSALGEMFSDRRYSAEMVKLLRARLTGEKVSYVIQGSSHGFGYLRDEGGGTTPIDPLPDQKEQVIDFDREEARPQADPAAAVTGMRIQALGGGRFRLDFRTDPTVIPRDLYLTLLEIRPWRLPREIGQAAYIDTSKALAAGANVLVLNDRSGPFSDLLARIEPGNVYVVKIAISARRRHLGPDSRDAPAHAGLSAGAALIRSSPVQRASPTPVADADAAPCGPASASAAIQPPPRHHSCAWS